MVSYPGFGEEKQWAQRICIDFINLNKVFPKESFPLPMTDQIVDAKASHELLNFMDAYSHYNRMNV